MTIEHFLSYATNVGQFFHTSQSDCRYLCLDAGNIGYTHTVPCTHSMDCTIPVLSFRVHTMAGTKCGHVLSSAFYDVQNVAGIVAW